MGIIEITIAKTTPAGKKGVAKTYHTAFEGELNDLNTLQRGVDNIIERILWGKPTPLETKIAEDRKFVAEEIDNALIGKKESRL